MTVETTGKCQQTENFCQQRICDAGEITETEAATASLDQDTDSNIIDENGRTFSEIRNGEMTAINSAVRRTIRILETF